MSIFASQSKHLQQRRRSINKILQFSQVCGGIFKQNIGITGSLNTKTSLKIKTNIKKAVMQTKTL